MTDPMQTEREALKPCPFCGHTGLIFSEGSTFRWRIAECQECGATAGEERIQTMGDGDAEAWETNCRERLIGAWNRRAESDERASELRSLRDALTLAKARIAELEGGEVPDQFLSALRAYADNEYCLGIRMAHREDKCLGWEAKLKAGKFGLAEMDAHEKMNKHFGAHYGIYEAINRARAALKEKGE
jgi:hypothetical protein